MQNYIQKINMKKDDRKELNLYTLSWLLSAQYL